MRVTIETARLAKEKGFNLKVSWYYYDTFSKHILLRDKPIDYSTYIKGSSYECIGAPSQSKLQKWLRNKHNIHIGISVNQFGYGYMYSLVDVKKGVCVKHLTGGVNDKFTFEQALEQGLQCALKLIENETERT